MKNYIIRPEKREDYREVENLIRESFWNIYRPGCSEHYVIHVLRNDPAFVQELDFGDGTGRQNHRAEYVHENDYQCR